MADEKKVTEVTAKDDAKARKKGPGLGKRMAKFFRDTRGEFSKITWPTFPTVVRNSGVTLTACILLGAVIALIDFGLSTLVRLMLSLG